MADLIDRQAAIDALTTVEETLNRVLDDMDVVGSEREKFAWGLGLIESCVDDMKELPSAQSEPSQCWGCNCTKMQKTFSEMVHLHDAEPVRHGRWVDETVVTGTTSGETTIIRQYRCSVCGNLFGRIDDRYCGRCGAKMDLEAEDG